MSKRETLFIAIGLILHASLGAVGGYMGHTAAQAIFYTTLIP